MLEKYRGKHILEVILGRSFEFQSLLSQFSVYCNTVSNKENKLKLGNQTKCLLTKLPNKMFIAVDFIIKSVKIKSSFYYFKCED